MGTVDDLERLMDAGYSKNLMLDYWKGTPASPGNDWNPFEFDVPYLVPAIKGMEGQKAPFARSGTCNLLVDNKCSIHSIKPVQGRTACCKVNRVYKDKEGKDQDLDERIPILHTWNTERGRELIQKWKKEINFGEQVDAAPEPPKSLGGLLDALMNVLSAKGEMLKPATEMNDLPHERETIEYQKIVYEKPY